MSDQRVKSIGTDGWRVQLDRKLAVGGTSVLLVMAVISTKERKAINRQAGNSL